MKAKVIQALLNLDPEDDNHWTNQGLPRVDVLIKDVGEEFKRQDITDIAPEFTRESLRLPDDYQDYLDQADQDDTGEDNQADQDNEPDSDEEAAEQDQDSPDDAQVDNQVELKELDDAITRKRQLKNKVEQEIEAVKKELNGINKELDTLVLKQTRLTSWLNAPSNATKLYLQRQHQIRIDKAQSMQQLKKAGFDLSKMQPKSQLDTAMARKRGRGGNRPKYPVQPKG